MMRVVVLSALFVATGLGAHAQTVAAPKVAVDDTWTVRDTDETKTTRWHETRYQAKVAHAGAQSIALSTHVADSEAPPFEHIYGPDWSVKRSVNGLETVVNQPLSFPLTIGKTWDVDFTENAPNRDLSSQRMHRTCRVMGWEDVTTPGGAFHAIKIECEGAWSATAARAVISASGARADAQGATSVATANRVGGGTVSGRIYAAIWYVPAVKRWVKSEEEYYDKNGIRYEQHTEQLESYKVSE